MHQSFANSREFTSGLCGIVVCGGKSSRMGTDKSMLKYHDRAQCYHLYEMLSEFSDEVYISCNKEQAGNFQTGYSTQTDLPEFENSGPVAALLTAFTLLPGKNILLIGCDYPFLTVRDIRSFLAMTDQANIATAFYNQTAGLYEPLLACYSQFASSILFDMHKASKHSLQHFLKDQNAAQFYPENQICMRSADTKADYVEISSIIGTIEGI